MLWEITFLHIIVVTLSHLPPPDPVEYYEQYDINEIKKSAPWVPAVVVCRINEASNFSSYW